MVRRAAHCRTRACAGLPIALHRVRHPHVALARAVSDLAANFAPLADTAPPPMPWHVKRAKLVAHRTVWAQIAAYLVLLAASRARLQDKRHALRVSLASIPMPQERSHAQAYLVLRGGTLPLVRAPSVLPLLCALRALQVALRLQMRRRLVICAQMAHGQPGCMPQRHAQRRRAQRVHQHQRRRHRRQRHRRRRRQRHRQRRPQRQHQVPPHPLHYSAWQASTAPAATSVRCARQVATATMLTHRSAHYVQLGGIHRRPGQ